MLHHEPGAAVKRKAAATEKALWGLLVLVGLGVTAWAGWSSLGKLRPSREAATPLPTVSAFQMTDQLGRTVTDADFKGRVWIAGFIFTGCPLSCPRITEALAELQKTVKRTDVVLVAVSVDPEHDTPEVLRRYAESAHADADRWRFLTGTKEELRRVENSFLTQSVFDPNEPDPGLAIAHSNRLMLVDRAGKVRGAYLCVEETVDEEGKPAGTFQIDQRELRRLARDAEDLAADSLLPLSVLPTINAILNGSSAILLIAGFLFIRGRLVVPHAACMLSAVVVSTLFLASYVYYHFHHGATRFTGEGLVRPVYYAILLSHTVLAAVVVPLVLWTLYRAARRQFDRHARIARWTLPIWLYVSVTGVVIYVLLYHIYA